MKVIGDAALSLIDFIEIVFQDKEISVSKNTLDNVEKNFKFLQNFSAHKLIYGINTGFGPMAQYKIGADKLLQLQYNLIRSHASGNGSLLPTRLVKALMLARLNSLMQARSGVHTDIIFLLQELINKNIFPCIYERGGVGASGDLVQLAHLGLALIGEGEVIYENKIHPTKDIFDRLNVKPLSVSGREGLAVVNGTSAMTGIGLVNLVHAQKILIWSVTLSAMMNEIVEAFDDHFAHELNAVKHHKGQTRIAAMMREILQDSGMIRNRANHFYHSEKINKEIFEDKVQEYYSLRCVTQVLGPVYDAIRTAEKVLVRELNSANDNPVIDHENKNIFHGGNFHGDYVSFEMDKLRIALTKLSMLSERQLNYLMNDKLNQKFPPFVNLGTLGLNFGMQGMQFTATSTVAENQTLSTSMYIHSIPNNNDNQDIVSMGCNAALLTRRVIDNTYTVLAVQLMSVLQAVDYLQCVQKLAPMTQSVYSAFRKVFPKFIEDEPKYKDLEKIKNFLENAEMIVDFN